MADSLTRVGSFTQGSSLRMMLDLKYHSLIQMLYLVFDESMSWWRPKNIKSIGLPNRTFDPRKSVPLGTIILNGVECSTGIIVHHDIVHELQEQAMKKYVDQESSLLRTEPTHGACGNFYPKLMGST